MYKRILLHGATNCGSSNYGDFLYGYIVYQFFEQKKMNVEFYQPSAFFMEYIENYNNIIKFKKNKADLIVYIPGGYFGEGHKAKLKENIMQFLRFMPLGIWASCKKKPIIVMGIGAGPINNIFMKLAIKRICNNAKFVTTRDNISYKELKKICPKANIIECGDLILTKKWNENKIKTGQINKIAGLNKKIILVHYNHDKEALKKFAEALNIFINNNKEYFVVVSADSILENEDEYYNEFKKIFKYRSEHFVYNNPFEMTELLKLSNVVLTCKLHIGVVSALYEKSVIAAACHPEKTMRFYEQINESNRCIELEKIEPYQLANLLEKYKEKRINIKDEVVDKANKTWKILEDFLGDENEKR